RRMIKRASRVALLKSSKDETTQGSAGSCNLARQEPFSVESVPIRWCLDDSGTSLHLRIRCCAGLLQKARVRPLWVSENMVAYCMIFSFRIRIARLLVTAAERLALIARKIAQKR